MREYAKLGTAYGKRKVISAQKRISNYKNINKITEVLLGISLVNYNVSIENLYNLENDMFDNRGNCKLNNKIKRFNEESIKLITGEIDPN
jgi:hypothetical protein